MSRATSTDDAARRSAYFAQTGRKELTTRQAKRARKKLNRELGRS